MIDITAITTVALAIILLRICYLLIPNTKLTASNLLVPAYNFDILVNINSNLVTITMNGPSNIWYGVGFGARVMDGTYAIIIRDVIEERMLGSHTSGSIISSFITVQNDTIDTINSIRTVVLTRPRIGDATHYSFPSSIDNINIIYAYGSSLVFYHLNKLMELLPTTSLPETIWMIISISLIFIATQYLKYHCCIIFYYTTFLYVFIVITKNNQLV